SSRPISRKAPSTMAAHMAEAVRATRLQALRSAGVRRTRHPYSTMPATRQYTKTSVQRKVNLGMALLEADARVEDRVGNVGQYQPDDIHGRPQENHGPHDGEVLRVDGIYGVAAQPRDAEERFGDQAAHEKQRYGRDRPCQDGQHRVAQ